MGQSEGQFSALVSMLKYAMSFQEPGQKGEVTPKAHISLTSSQRIYQEKYVNQIYNEKGIGSVHSHISSSS